MLKRIKWGWVWFMLFSVSFSANIWQHETITKLESFATYLYQQEQSKEKKTKDILVKYIRLHNSRLTYFEVTRMASMFVKAGAEFKVDPILLAALGRPESGFDTLAVSTAGALGIMQVMPFWAEHIAFVQTDGNLLDPETNIRAGAYILAKYIKDCGGIEPGLRCYNGGYRAILEPRPVTLDHVKNVLNIYSTMRM